MLELNTSPRFLLTRGVGLILFAGLYMFCFGQEEPPRPRAEAALPAAAADENGLSTLRLTETIEIRLDEEGPFHWAGLTNGPGGKRVRIVMAGPGPALRLVGTHAGTADPQTVRRGVWEREAGPMLEGLEIVGEHPEACGIELDGTMQATLSRITVRQCKDAIRLVNRNRNVIIADCHLYENSGCGVLLDDVNLHQINITGCHISYCRGGGVVSRKGNVRNLHITGCDLESNHGEEHPATANVLIDCRESSAGTAEVAITGCTIQHNSQGPESANVRIIGRSLPMKDQEVVREGHVTISGNIFSDVQTNVHLKDCRGVTLTGNTFWMGYEWNLLVEDSTHIVVGPNNFDRNPRYAYGTAKTTRNALRFVNCSDCTLTGLHIAYVQDAEAGLVLEKCRWMNISGCTLLENSGDGLLLKDCEHCLVSGCMIRQRGSDGEQSKAIRVSGGTDVRISPVNLPGTAD